MQPLHAHCLAVPLAPADTILPTPPPGSSDELWFVSARDLNCQTDDISQLQCQVWQGDGWQQASFFQLVEAVQTDQSRENVFFVHGNRTDEYWAKRRGCEVCRTLFGGCDGRPPVRFIIWAWRSDKCGNPRRDFQIKSARAVRVARLFSATVEALQGPRPPLIVGYSLGGQVIASAFADQRFACHRQGCRIALIAPVLNCCFSGECYAGGADPEAVFCTLVLSNRRDPVVTAAEWFCRRRSQGQPWSFRQWVDQPSQPLGPTREVDITAESCASHKLPLYLQSPTLVCEIRQLLSTQGAPCDVRVP